MLVVCVSTVFACVSRLFDDAVGACGMAAVVCRTAPSRTCQENMTTDESEREKKSKSPSRARVELIKDDSFVRMECSESLGAPHARPLADEPRSANSADFGNDPTPSYMSLLHEAADQGDLEALRDRIQ